MTIKSPVLMLILLSFLSLGFAQLPDPGFEIDNRTAIVITDPQNDFLSPDGVAWGVVGQAVQSNKTVENLEALFKVADQKSMQVFVDFHKNAALLGVDESSPVSAMFSGTGQAAAKFVNRPGCTMFDKNITPSAASSCDSLSESPRLVDKSQGTC